MKRKTKKLLVAIAGALVVIMLAAGLVMLLRKDSFGDNYFTRNQAVATVNGVKITKNEFVMAVSNYYSNIDYYNMYASFGYGTYYEKDEAGMKALKNDILNGLIYDEVYIQMAKDLGITLTDEEKAAVKQSAQDALDSLKSQILESAQSAGYQNPETYAVTMLATYFSNMGINQRIFLKRNERAATAEKLADKIEAYYVAERNVTDDELESLYADYVKANYEDVYQDGNYSQTESYVALGYMDIPYLWIPEDFFFVRVIQLSDEDKANEIMEAIEGGADFETYFDTEDNENTTGKAMGEKAQAIGAKDSPFNEEVYKKVGYLGVDEVALVEGVAEDGIKTFYIVKRVEGTTGMVPYEEVKDIVADSLKSSTGKAYADEKTEEWMKNAVVINEDLIQAYDPMA